MENKSTPSVPSQSFFANLFCMKLTEHPTAIPAVRRCIVQFETPVGYEVCDNNDGDGSIVYGESCNWTDLHVHE